MAYASVTYTSASGTTFALTNSNGDPIPYIRQSDIKVYVNNVLQTVTTDYTFNTAGTAIVLNSPVSGATVLLQRITDITDPTVVYTAGSTLTAQDLNNADNQIRYGLQEFQDSVNAGGGVPDGDKGDITVAGNGTIWTIDSGAVVEAKIASGAVTETKIGTGAVTSAKIADGTIVNADINASAAIAHNKLANITAGSVLLGDASNVPTATALSGDVTVDSSGVTAIGSGVIVDADINNSAAIALSKLATGALPTAITVASANIVDGTIVDADINANAEIAVSKLADGTARQLLQTDAAGTGVEWTSNVDIPGTLDVTGAAVFDSTANIAGNLTVDTNTLFVDATNNRVGIGTASAGAKLEVATGDGEYARVNRTGTTGQTGYLISSAGTNVAMLAANDTTGEVRFGGVATNFFPTFWSNNAERARIDTSGRLLVGTSSAPTATESSKSLLVVNGNTSGSAQQGEILLNNGADISGEFGLGAIYFGGESNGQVGASINAVAESAWNTGGDTTDSPGRLVFSTTADGASSPTERMRILQNSDVQLLGTGNVFSVESSGAPGTTVRTIFSGHSSTGFGTRVISFQVWNNGNVQNTNNSYGAISDVKLKENIVDATSQWDDLKALQVRKYNFKEETGQETHTQIGLIAQEVELVSPGLVTESPDRDADGNDLGTVTKSVNYSVLYMKAVKALQEAMERIETLEAKVAALEAV